MLCTRYEIISFITLCSIIVLITLGSYVINTYLRVNAYDRGIVFFNENSTYNIKNGSLSTGIEIYTNIHVNTDTILRATVKYPPPPYRFNLRTYSQVLQWKHKYTNIVFPSAYINPKILADGTYIVFTENTQIFGWVIGIILSIIIMITYLVSFCCIKMRICPIKYQKLRSDIELR